MQLNNYTVLKLVSEDIVPEENNGQINHIWIYDRSGSMVNTLADLCDNILDQAKLLKVNDTLTICWFSGEGQNGCILKGFKISNNDDYKFIEKALDNNNTTIGTTCFSESLFNLRSIIDDIKSIFSDRIALCLFTDGYPVVNNYKSELNNIFGAIDNIKNDLSATLFIGYGESYNKELMVNMTERIGGTLIHNSTLKDTSKTLTDFVEDSKLLQRSEIRYPHKLENIILSCSSYNKRICIHDTNSQTFNVLGSELYLLLNKDNDINDINDIYDDKVLYALSAGLVQKAKTDIALELLNHLGDKYLIDKVVNAFSNGEYGEAEDKILLAMSDENYRYKDGKVVNYLPNENAFCLLDLFFLLMNDKSSVLILKNSTDFSVDENHQFKHESFGYKKIGKKSVVKEGYAKFVPDKNVGVPISSLTWHKEKLNLSILVKIPGTVDIHNDMDFSDDKYKSYPTFQYRNYTIIKNGVLNVEKFPLTCSKETMEILIGSGIEIEIGYGIDILYLNSIPFINKSLVKNRSSAKNLANKALEELKLQAKMKVINSKNPKVKMIEELSKDLSDHLISKGFRNDGSYCPPVETTKNSELNDYYMAKTLKIKIKGGSSIPKVENVETKIKNEKKLNFVEEFMKEAINECKNNDLDELQKKTKKELKEVRKYIQETKFALLLAKKWFDEFNSFDNCTINTDSGIQVTFELGEEKIMID